ncbi:MAG: 50S ribosomal protein L23 [Ignavibacteriaceae bacterium]|nr:50S ribosomal protein L23 [Ignavibacteriaceae bacterium]
MRNVLVKPLFTEKMTKENQDLQKYGFIVISSANKIEIAKAIKDKYNVTVADVNTVNYRGKVKTQMRKSGRFTGRTAKFKKAYITLKKGEKIDLYGEA